jgi:hypothetical protein
MTPSLIIKLMFVATVAFIVYYIVRNNKQKKDEES